MRRASDLEQCVVRLHQSRDGRTPRTPARKVSRSAIGLCPQTRKMPVLAPSEHPGNADPRPPWRPRITAFQERCDFTEIRAHRPARRGARACRRVMRGQRQYPSLRILSTDPPQGLQSAHARHRQIHHVDIGFMLGIQKAGRFAGVRFRHDRRIAA